MTFTEAVELLARQQSPLTRGYAARAVMAAVNSVPSGMFWDWYPASLAVFGYHKPGDPIAGGPRAAGEYLDADQERFFWISLGALAHDLDRKGVPFTMVEAPTEVEALGFIAQLVNEKLKAATVQPTWTGTPITSPWADLEDPQASVKLPGGPDVDPGKIKPPGGIERPITENPIVGPILDAERVVTGVLLAWIGYEILQRLD